VETKAIAALEQVKGDLSGNQAKLRKALARPPARHADRRGHHRRNRNAIADIFLTEVAVGSDGKLYNKVVKVIPQVNQSMNMDKAKFLALGRGRPDESGVQMTSAHVYPLRVRRDMKRQPG
jgi:branched-chain amino acid transport system substrate-binding protein